MTFDADILERPAPIAPRERDRRIAVAGRWVCMLDALREIAVRFSCFLAHKVAPPNEVPKGPILALPFVGEPITAFVRAARAMQLAVALAFRIENEIDALRAGKSLGPDACISQASRPETTGVTKPSEADIPMTDPGEKDREMALQAIVEAAETPERPEGLLGTFLRGRFNATIRKGPGFDRLLKGPLKDAVAAICADLGLKPDWSLWTENGFPPPFAGTKEDWIAFFVPKGDMAPRPSPDLTEPLAPPRKPVCDPLHLLDPPRRELHAFLAAHGVKPLPPPPFQRSACRLPPVALRRWRA